MIYLCCGPDPCPLGHRTALDAVLCSERRGRWWTVVSIRPSILTRPSNLADWGFFDIQHPTPLMLPGAGVPLEACWTQCRQAVEFRDRRWIRRHREHCAALVVQGQG